MGNRQSTSTLEFVNNSDCARVEITVGNHSKALQTKGAVTKFEITEATQSMVRGFDKSGRLIHEVKFMIGGVASSQVWKITNSGVKHKRSPFFTENYTWIQNFMQATN